ASIGLPAGTDILALALFNIGVELGQVLFVGAVLAVVWLVMRIKRVALPTLIHVAAYGVGIAGTYWIIERLYATFLPLL
ncbi:MAG: HupE/UreJ family protein, partial [Alphaproteobacteria bacterium]|nr:HupE/UreJ family protein [Alphaproteobacteria bacterium]